MLIDPKQAAITLEDILTNKAKDKMKSSADLTKIAHLLSPGSVITDAGGLQYRVASKSSGPNGFSFRLANLQGKPVPTPADFYPVNRYAAKLAKWMRFVLAYNAEWDQYVKEYIRAAGLPVDESYNWAKWFQAKFYPKLKGDDEIKDEAIHHTIITALAQRRALEESNPSGFSHAIKRFPEGVQKLPLEKQVTQFLLTLFSGRVQEANQFIDKMQDPRSVSIDEGWSESPDTGKGSHPGEGDVGDARSVLDVEEHATQPVGQEQAEFKADMEKFRDRFSEWLSSSNRPETTKNYMNLLDAMIYFVLKANEEPKISDIYPFWAHLTKDEKHPKGLGFDSLKQYWSKFPQLVHECATEYASELQGNPLVAFAERMTPAKAVPAKASLLGGLKFADECIGAEYCPQCHLDADHCRCPNKTELLSDKTVGEEKQADVAIPENWQCLDCGHEGMLSITGKCEACGSAAVQSVLPAPPERARHAIAGEKTGESVLKKGVTDLYHHFQEQKKGEVDAAGATYVGDNDPDKMAEKSKTANWTMKCPHCQGTAAKETHEGDYRCPKCQWSSKDASTKTAEEVGPDMSEAKAEVVSPDTVDPTIKQPTEPIEKQAAIETEERDEVACSKCGTRGSAKHMWDESTQSYLCDDCSEKLNSKTAKQVSVSCWGCGGDWSHRWSANDLAPVKIEGVDYHICPDCIEDVGAENIEFTVPEESNVPPVSTKLDNLRPRQGSKRLKTAAFGVFDDKFGRSVGPTVPDLQAAVNLAKEFEMEKGTLGEERFLIVEGQPGISQMTFKCYNQQGEEIKMPSKWASTKTAVIPHEFRDGIRPQTNIQDTGRLEGDTGPQSPSERDPNWRVTGDIKESAAAAPANPGVGGAAGLTPNQNPNAGVPSKQQQEDEPEKGVGPIIPGMQDSGSGLDEEGNQPMKKTVPPDLPFQRLHIQSLRARERAASLHLAGANRDIMKKLDDAMIFDRVGWSGKYQEYVCKETYFYTHGRNEDKLAEAVKKLIPEAVITSARNYWHSWPKESYWEVRFKVPPKVVDDFEAAKQQFGEHPPTTEPSQQEAVMAEPKTQSATASKRAAVLERIKARKAAKNDAKWATLRRVADENSPEAAEALDQLAQAFGELADRVDAFRENLDLVDAPKTASLKTRIAARRALGGRLKKYAEENPQILADAVNELFKSLDDVAAGVEAFAENMGIELNMTPVEEAFVDEGKAEVEHGETEGEEIAGGGESEPVSEPVEEELPVEANSGGGAKGWVTDRDENGQPKTPEKINREPQTSAGAAPPK